MTERALQILAIPEDKFPLILDVGYSTLKNYNIITQSI